MRDFCVGERVHFVGMGGVGVNSLAKLTLDMGGSVSGSDAKWCGLCEDVVRLGGEMCAYNDADCVRGATGVVYSSAIPKNHPQLQMAKKLSIPTFERHEYLGLLAKKFDRVLAVGGTHGKTSVTSMICHILQKANASFVGLIGGESVKFSNYVNNIKDKDDIFVSEACEYRQSLLSLDADVAVVTNAECDHPDCYKNIQSVHKVFQQFLAGASINVVPSSLTKLVSCKGLCARFDCESLQKGQNSACVFKIDKQKGEGDVYEAVVPCGDKRVARLFENDKYVCDFLVADNERYVVANTLFSIVAATALGVSVEDACCATKDFDGVKRRFECIGTICNARVIFDFAHHPSEIECAINRAKKLGKVMVVFQPHTYTRTKAYFDDFVRVLLGVDTLLLMQTYGARESENVGCTSQELFEAIFDKSCKKTVYLSQNAQSTIDFVNCNAQNFDVVLMLGAGDIYALKDQFCCEPLSY